MGILLMIAVEIIASAIIISHKPLNTPNVLGTKLAQAVDVPPDQSPPADSSPIDTPTPTQQPEPSPTQNPTDQTASPQPTPPPPDSFSANSMENHPDTSPSPTETPQDQSPTAQENQTIAPTPTPTPSPAPPSENSQGQESADNQPLINFSSAQQTAVLDTNQILTTPDNISEKSSRDVQNEEAKLAQNTSPESQASLVLNIITDKPAQIASGIKSGDFGSANFAASRMGDFVDKIQEIIKNLPPSRSSLIKKETENLCAKSDYILKSAQLMVPENSEQDLEIARGKCLSINL